MKNIYTNKHNILKVDDLGLSEHFESIATTLFAKNKRNCNLFQYEIQNFSAV